MTSVEAFAENGYFVEDHVFEAEECRILAEELCECDSNIRRGGIRNLMSNQHVVRIANDQRLSALLLRLTSLEMTPYKATLFEKTGKANWLVAFHQDTALPVETFLAADGWGPRSTKRGITFAHAPTSALNRIVAIRIHLDDSTSINGPLRVIPGSHQRRLREDPEFGAALSSRRPVECLTNRGGVIAMSPLILHASSKILADKPRRVLHIEHTDSLDIAEGIRLAVA